MVNFNRVILGGNITRDPILNMTTNGTEVCDFGIAVNRKWKDKETAMFIDVRFFGKLATIVAEHFHKGDPILLEGRLDFSTWTVGKDENGKEIRRSKHKVIGENFQFIKSKETPF